MKGLPCHDKDHKVLINDVIRFRPLGPAQDCLRSRYNSRGI